MTEQATQLTGALARYEAKLLTARQAADRLGVSVRQLDRYVAAGLIAPRRATARAHRRFDPVDVDGLLDPEAPPLTPADQ